MNCKLNPLKSIFLFLLFLFIIISCSALTPQERPSYSPNEFVLWMPGAVSVQVIGDWNEWGGIEHAGGVLNPGMGRMAVNDSGIWEIEIKPELAEGRYRYAFLIDGCEIIADPLNPETAFYDGYTVSVLAVTH